MKTAAAADSPARGKGSGAVQQWIAGIILAVLGAAMLVPLVWMILSAFKPESEVTQIPPTLLPHQFTLGNFQNLFQNMRFGYYLRNTLIIVFFSFVGLFLNAMAGFGFAKYKFKLKDKLFYIVLATMMIPGQVTMIPIYLILNQMRLTNTMPGVVLPGLVGAFGIFLFRQFMTAIPDELLEA
ncbi:carbohydrate ABC transporter permease, partial [Paenibacillus sepulcri]|nr:carbohydrate ABC transporter permease [Paenibacillus sepulcri]